MRSGGSTFGALILISIAAAARAQTPLCAECHPSIWQSYRPTPMARSFFRPRPENTIEDYTNHNTYDHAASGIRFEMMERNGKYFQRQYQIGFDGKPANLTDTEIDFVLGSGDHSRTYLHRTAANTLIELPLGWYAEKGGYWAMNPGYDRPDHQSRGRAIGYDCMFCHNAYAEIPPGQGPRSDAVFLRVPEGINCQRCHGDGQEHVRRARTGRSAADIRGAILNPARLAPDRRMEVCMQCHLETTSFSTVNSIVRYERQPYSYSPAEPLVDFRLHFDRKADKKEDRFEIVNAAYRLRQSQCFLKSSGALTCTTCHDPHATVPQQDMVEHYSAICRHCHAAKIESLTRAGRHPPSADCTACHMPRRRTQDAVHVVMTDHYIQRTKPPGDLLTALPERPPDYRGGVVPYYPATLTGADELYLAVAQVNEASTRSEGIARLSAAIAKHHPAAAEFYLQLGDALRASGRFEEAIAPYQEAVRREPQSARALERFALGLARVREFAKADKMFKQALQLAPDDAVMWEHLGTAYLEQKRMPDAAAAFEKSLTLDATLPESHNGLAGVRMDAGNVSGAEAEFREAIRLRPNYAEALHNLANVLAGSGRFEEARYEFEQAVRIRPNHGETRLDYARMLLRAGRTEDAIGQLSEVVRLAPDSARANLELGAALAGSGEIAAARPYLQKAARSNEAGIRVAAQKLLEKIR